MSLLGWLQGGVSNVGAGGAGVGGAAATGNVVNGDGSVGGDGYGGDGVHNEGRRLRQIGAADQVVGGGENTVDGQEDKAGSVSPHSGTAFLFSACMLSCTSSAHAPSAKGQCWVRRPRLLRQTFCIE